MLEGALWRDRRQILGGSGAERTSRCRQHDATHLATAACPHALVHRVVLAVNRQQRGTKRPRCGHDQIPGGDEHFLVCQCHALASLDSRIGRRQADHSDCGRDENVGARSDRGLENSVRSAHEARPVAGNGSDPIAKVSEGARVRDRQQGRTKLDRLPDEPGDVPTGRKGHYLDCGPDLADDLKSVAPNRAGRSDQREPHRRASLGAVAARAQDRLRSGAASRDHGTGRSRWARCGGRGTPCTRP